MKTHYSPRVTPGLTPSFKYRRALCGVFTRLGYDRKEHGTTYGGEPLGAGSSNEANVTCEACREAARREDVEHRRTA